MQYLLSSLIGYIFGSIPTAYLVLKKSQGIDITKKGSGNVGAMNSYEITKSKVIGFLVFFVDFSKGLIPVILTKLLFNDIFIFPALSLLFTIIAHCFNPWINFKGGRGLATSAGGVILFFPYLLLVWIILWILIFIFKKDILVANIIATLLSILVIYFTLNIALYFVYPLPDSIGELLLLSTSGLIIIFIKHIEPLKEIISQNQRNKK